MAFTKAKPYAPVKTGSGIRASITTYRTSEPTLSISLSRKAQEELFGEPLAEKTVDILAGRGEDQGTFQIVLSDDGQFRSKSKIQESVRYRVRVWEGLPIEPQKPADCEPLEPKAGDPGIRFRLPAWSRPRLATGQRV